MAVPASQRLRLAPGPDRRRVQAGTNFNLEAQERHQDHTLAPPLLALPVLLVVPRLGLGRHRVRVRVGRTTCIIVIEVPLCQLE